MYRDCSERLFSRHNSVRGFTTVLRALPNRVFTIKGPELCGVLGVHPRGVHKNGSQTVLSQDCMDDEGQQSTPLLQLPAFGTDWCVVWCCHAFP